MGRWARTRRTARWLQRQAWLLLLTLALGLLAPFFSLPEPGGYPVSAQGAQVCPRIVGGIELLGNCLDSSLPNWHKDDVSRPSYTLVAPPG
jgi:hypothetical protein